MSTENLAGQTLGQYQLKSLLGKGGMGAVYLAYQTNLKREVAFKVLPGNIASQPGYIERFFREARIAAGLEHPNIVPLYDFGTERNITYVAMRLLTGGTLAQRLQPEGGKFQPLSLRDITLLLMEIGSALDYAHQRGIVHRDIKPGNIMFDSKGSAYLVDFGIAKAADGNTNLTGTGMMVGTPHYMAPELWMGQNAVAASDQYALAAMLYGVMTGHLPFEATTPYALMQKHMNDMPRPLHTLRTDVPQTVGKVLERALAKDPTRRYPTVSAFATAFSQAVAASGDDATGPVTLPRQGGQPSRGYVPPVQPTPAPRREPSAAVPTPRAQRGQNRLLIPLFLVILVLIAILAALIVPSLIPASPPLTEVTPGATDANAQVVEPSATATEPGSGAIVILATAPQDATQNAVVADATDEPAETEVPDAATATDAPTETALPTDTAAPTEGSSLIVIVSADTQTPEDTAVPTVTEATREVTVEATVEAPVETAEVVEVAADTPTESSVIIIVAQNTATQTSTTSPTATRALTATPIPTLPPTETATFTDAPTERPTATTTRTRTSTPAPTVTALPAATDTATHTATPIETLIPTATTTPTITDTPTETRTPIPCTIHADHRDVPVRVRPLSTSVIRRGLPPNVEYNVRGMSEDMDGGLWWNIEMPNVTTELDRYWVRESDVIESGDCDLVEQLGVTPTAQSSGGSGRNTREMNLSVTLNNPDNAAYGCNTLATFREAYPVSFTVSGVAYGTVVVQGSDLNTSFTASGPFTRSFSVVSSGCGTSCPSDGYDRSLVAFMQDNTAIASNQCFYRRIYNDR